MLIISTQLPFMQLSNSKLNEICLEVVNSPYHYYTATKDYFHDLYITGCRPVELLTFNKWKRFGDHYELTTAKTEGKRIINSAWLSNKFNYGWTEDLLPYDGLTFDQLTLEYKKSVPLAPLVLGKKGIDMYLFRYNRARQLYESTKEVTKVMDHFGWLSATVAWGYISQPIEFNPYFRL